MAPSNGSRDARGILIEHIKKTYEQNAFPQEWRNLPEIPSSAEIKPVYRDPVIIQDQQEEWNAYQRDVLYDEKLPHNVVKGPWPSKEAYLGAHYQIIREDSIASLRNAVTEVQTYPSMEDNRETCIYTGVTFIGLQLSRTGIASRVAFSCERAGKQIRWEQSKRLVQGTLVALTPERDMFKTVCKIATVAARAIEGGLDQNPPTIDLFWGDPAEMVLDPVEKYVMVESRQGYFESSRHTMVAMQKMMTERFSFAKELVELDSTPEAPLYIQQKPYMNLRSLETPAAERDGLVTVPSSDTSLISDVDVLDNFPKDIQCEMDKSQMTACRNMLTSRLAIVQGPPGTGKTFVSVSGLEVMIRNLGPDDPPIIVSAQTNHALDQLLNHIMVFEEEIVRLGGQSDRGNLAIKSRTFYELRRNRDVSKASHGLRVAFKEHVGLCDEIIGILSPLLNNNVLTADTLFEYGIITKGQRKSLEAGDWVVEKKAENVETEDLAGWLTESQLMPIQPTPSVNLGLALEDGDIEFEQLQDLALETAEAGGPDEKEPEFGLGGNWLPFSRRFTGRHSTPVVDGSMRRKLSRCKDLFEIPVADRGQMYRYFEKQVNSHMSKKFQEFLPKYQRFVEDLKITRAMCNIKLMQQLGVKVVGCTTTGLSKYRGFLSALEPRTLLIEEAAETLESKIIAGMMESLQQLILVGDHKQLQASCTVQALEHGPYHLSVSMFERLVNNSMPFVMLNHQRRMIPDVRKLLCIPPTPFYENLYDHESVLDRVNNRPPVPGMGGLDTYFFSHNWIESRTFDGSCFNLSEADMIAEFFNYLILNGVEAAKITVLTFYNGQRKTIIKQLKKHPSLQGVSYFHVFTVDSYQGEENDIILLSMVRSNQNLGVGFLDNRNRLVVALSRARCGLYLFGNSVTLTAGETTELGYGRDALFDPLIMFMAQQGRYDLDGGLPITCAQHNTVTRIFDADGWAQIAGGCQRRCEGGILPCGHACTLLCHPFDHSRIICREACPNSLPCGHGCSRNCGETCVCDQCHVAESALAFVPDNFEYWGQDPSASSASSRSPTKSALRIGGSGHRQLTFNDQQNPYSHSDVRHDLHLSSSQVSSNGRPMPANSRTGFPGRRVGSHQTSGQSTSYGSDSARSSPVKSRHGRSSATRNQLQPVFGGYGQGNIIDMNHPGFEKWQNYNAKKADAEIDEKQRIEAAKAPKVDPSTFVIKETFRPVVIKNGVRTKDPSGPVRTLIQPRRLKIEESLATPISASAVTPEQFSNPKSCDSEQQVSRKDSGKKKSPPSNTQSNDSGKFRQNQGSAKFQREYSTVDSVPHAAMEALGHESSDATKASLEHSVQDAIRNGETIATPTVVPIHFWGFDDLLAPPSPASGDSRPSVESVTSNFNGDLLGLAGSDEAPKSVLVSGPVEEAGPWNTSVLHNAADFTVLDAPAPLHMDSSPVEKAGPWTTSVLDHSENFVSADAAVPLESVSTHVKQAGQLMDLLSISDLPECSLGSGAADSNPPVESAQHGIVSHVGPIKFIDRLDANHPEIVAFTSAIELEIEQTDQTSDLLGADQAFYPNKLDDDGNVHDEKKSTLSISASEMDEQLAGGLIANSVGVSSSQLMDVVSEDVDLLIDFRYDSQTPSLASNKSLIDESDVISSVGAPTVIDDDEDLITF